MSSQYPTYGQVDRDYAIRLATTPSEDDGPVWMVNLMKYREIADYADGRDSKISGREADDLYTPMDSLAGVGAEIVFVGDVEQQLLGDAPAWDRIAVVKYPTRRSFIEMQSREDFTAKHHHKEAGMEQTIVIGSQPIVHPSIPETDMPDWAEVPHPPTDTDGPLIVLHVLKYESVERPDMSSEDMLSYQTAAGVVAVPHGVRIDGWFGVEGTIVGDGRSWDQVRFNAFPSKRAFMAVLTDPARVEAQKLHREKAIADSYTMLVRPVINRLRELTAT